MSNKQNDLIEDFYKKETEGRKKSQKPLCVLIGGLPGAGKKNLEEMVEKIYPDRDFVVIDADNYRILHPDYKELQKTPEKVVTATIEFANSIEAELIRRSFNQKCDIISVTSLRATDAIDNVLYVPAMKLGYDIEVHIMSTPIFESGLSTKIRYEDQIRNGECPRFVTMDFIKLCNDGIIKTIRRLQEKKEKPRIMVYKRGEGKDSDPIVIYDSGHDSSSYSCALEAYMNPGTNINSKSMLNQIEQLYNQMKSRNACEQEMRELDYLKKQFLINQMR